jgi:uncharacterized damage-inducible protein DinB
MHASAHQDVLHHMEWADSRAWNAVLAMPRLAHDEWMRDHFHHFHSTQWAYLQTFRGEAIRIPELDTLADLAAVGRWARQFYRELPAFRDALDDAAMRRFAEFPWSAQLVERLGSVGPATVGECILQLGLHSSHHRGQILTRIRETGGEPPMTDYIAWIWLKRPSPEWGTRDERDPG